MSSLKQRLFLLICPPSGLMTNADRLLLHWLGISALALAAVTLCSLWGLVETVELEQIRILAGSPFFIDAEEAQVNLMGPGGSFALSLVTALWLTMVLLRERRFIGRVQVTLLSLVVLALPGLLCVLWGGVLNMAMPLLTVLLCFIGCELRPVARSLRRRLSGR